MDYSIGHTLRESNMGADFLANLGLGIGKKCLFDSWEAIHRHLSGIIKIDVI